MSSKNGTTAVKKEIATATKASTPTSAKVEEVAKVLKTEISSKVKSQTEIIKQRMDKRTKLATLYKDIDALEKAQSDFDSIQSYGDIRITVYSGQTSTFSTTRQDSVEEVLKTIQENISQKLAKAQKELAEFVF